MRPNEGCPLKGNHAKLWLPFTAATLPVTFGPSDKARFPEMQEVVISRAVDFEKDPNRRHCHFTKEDLLPFTAIAVLGSGGQGSVDKVLSSLSYREFARKRFRRSKNLKKDDVRGFLNELQFLKKIRHYHCVELVCQFLGAS
jgi:serine/threonine protein kinase